MPPDRKAVIRRNFSRAAPTYEGVASFQQETAAAILANAPEKASQILDIGCGTGLLTRKLASRYPGAHIDAVDFSQEAIDVARNLAAKTAVHIEFFCADAENLAPSFQAYDLITANLAVHWCDNPAKTLELLVGRLNPDGILLYTVPSDENWPEWQALVLSATGVPRFAVKNNWPGLIDTIRYKENYPDSLSFLRQLRGSGVQTPLESQNTLSVGSLKKICRRFDQGKKEISWIGLLGRLHT